MKPISITCPAILGIFAVGVMNLAQASDVATPVAMPDFVKSQVNEVQLPAHRQLAVASGDLKQSARAFCAAPDSAGFAQLQAQYLNTLKVWRMIEVAPMGPTSDSNIGRIMAGVPPSHAQLEPLIAQLPEHLEKFADGQADEEASKLPDWGIGMKVISTMLYGDKPEGSIERLRDANHCSYLIWQSQVLSFNADNLVRSWQGIRQGLPYDMSYPRAFLSEYLNRIAQGAREIARDKVGLNQPQWLDQREGATVASLRANVAGLRAMLTGNQGAGLDDYMGSRGDQAMWQKVETALVKLEAALPTSDKNLTPKAGKKIASAANALADVLAKDIATLIKVRVK
ncbi:imelysin family protein [Chitinibacter sp. S2-10]|uniref:imelysin family protein n=1 Tax=Chitinibacter sp. S2-10 TaxID=3373597 RepID=UPI003977CCC1